MTSSAILTYHAAMRLQQQGIQDTCQKTPREGA